MNRAELYTAYAERVVEDMDVKDLMSMAVETIEERLEDFPETEALEEISESTYSEILDDYDGEQA